MNTSELVEMKKLISEQYNLSPVTNLQAEIVFLYKKFPRIKPANIWYQLSGRYSKNAVYTAIRRLKELGIIVDNKFVYLEKPAIKLNYPFPDHILNKNLPPVGFKWAHIAAYLTKFRDDEVVPIFAQTREQIIKDIQNQVTESPLVAQNYVFEFQNLLALFSIFANELTNWEDMKGTIEIREQ